MTRYMALLRGVSPMNLGMARLRETLETAGFERVKTIIASGNVAFDSRARNEAALAARIEALLREATGRTFPVTLRSTRYLQQLLADDPFAGHAVPAQAKRVVSFLLDEAPSGIPLPAEHDGARMLELRGRECYSCYLPGRQNAGFMQLIEQTLGKRQTTRTWETVKRCADA